MCMEALLYKQVCVPEVDLPTLDDNFWPKDGDIAKFSINQEVCYYGTRCRSSGHEEY